MDNKSVLRKKAKSIREKLNIELISKQIVNKIINLKIFQEAQHIMLYYPLENEIDILDLLNHEEKKFYLPRINGQNLECCPYKNRDILKESVFKTKEPITNFINPKILDLIFVPALMADKNKFRLGYGKGYYDRFLENTNATTIIPIAKELIIDTLPIEQHDKKVNYIITQ